MLTAVSFAIFWYWLGYMLRRMFGFSARKAIQVAGAVVAAAVMLPGAVFLVGESSLAGLIAFACGAGMYYSLGLTAEQLRSLQASWAGLWMFALFLVVQGAIELIVLYA